MYEYIHIYICIISHRYYFICIHIYMYIYVCIHIYMFTYMFNNLAWLQDFPWSYACTYNFTQIICTCCFPSFIEYDAPGWATPPGATPPATPQVVGSSERAQSSLYGVNGGWQRGPKDPLRLCRWDDVVLKMLTLQDPTKVYYFLLLQRRRSGACHPRMVGV